MVKLVKFRPILRIFSLDQSKAIREAFKKKEKKSVTFFTLGGGVKIGLHYTFFFKNMV